METCHHICKVAHIYEMLKSEINLTCIYICVTHNKHIFFFSCLSVHGLGHHMSVSSAWRMILSVFWLDQKITTVSIYRHLSQTFTNYCQKPDIPKTQVTKNLVICKIMNWTISFLSYENWHNNIEICNSYYLLFHLMIKFSLYDSKWFVGTVKYYL
jgi:hypothetical protein